MKNKLLFMFLFLFFSLNIYAQAKYVLNKDTFLYEKEGTSSNFTRSSNKVYKGDIIEVYEFDALNTNPTTLVARLYNKPDLYVEISALNFISNSYYFPDNLIHKYFMYEPNYYFDALKQNDAELIREKESWWKEENGWVPDKCDDYPLSWDEEFVYQYSAFTFTEITINTSYALYFIENIQKDGDTFFVKSKYRNSVEYDKSPRSKYLKFKDYDYVKNKETIVFILEFEGDYLTVYIDSKENYLGTYCRSDGETAIEITNFVRNNVWNRPYNLSDIIWPHHADGTSEYESIIKVPESLGETTYRESLLQAQRSSTNVSSNKTMTVSENLKLRSGEATTTQVLTIMSAGTKVKILEFGKAETIDGINSNWVKVEVQKGAKDRDGKLIKAGTVGWCYGGFLK